MTNKHQNSKTRTVRTTILTVDRTAIDWERFCQQCHIVRYDIRGKGRNESASNYYGRMHIWYKQESDYPCYLHTYGPHLYVKYGAPHEVAPLSYEGRPLRWLDVNVQDEKLLPHILKLLLADFFQVDGRFVSNADFFLWATADKEFVTGLRIKLTHNWQEDEFVISDQAARLRKLRPSDFDGINEWKRNHKVYYGRFYQQGMAIFKQLKPDELTRKQLKEGIYELFEGSRTNRASLTFHSTKSLRTLRQTRSYLLNQFIEKFLTYLHGLGLPFRQKRLLMQPVHTKSTASMKMRQLPPETKPICIVDDRINAALRPDDFAARFCAVANEATSGHDTLFVVKTEEELQPGDWVLRIQDYNGDEFDSENGLLRDLEDGKAAFYARHPDVVKQTLTVNKNSKRLQENTSRKKTHQWTVDEYLDYPVPSAKEIQTDLEVCRNQLLLKDVVMFPQDVVTRLPQVEKMAGTIFLYNQALVYFDGSNLHFLPVANNFEEASAFIKAHTGWNLLDDVLIPSAEGYYFDYTKRQTALEDTTKRPFLISHEFVWEIREKNGRVLNEDPEIQKRLEAFEQPRPVRDYYPVPTEQSPFSPAQLQTYQAFLRDEVKQSELSYTQLVKQYGKHIRDENGRIHRENEGFFHLLGIPNAHKFRKYLRDCVGLPLESVRESTLFPVYQGIWYAPDTHHYVAGVKDPNPEEQEKGHALRRIIVHQGSRDPHALYSQLTESFFPLMEVNFIRYRNYTVVPFPFKLIEIWQTVQQQEYIHSFPAR